MDALAREQLAAQAELVRLRGGENLFTAGAVADTLYIVATGRLRAVYPDGRVAGDIARLEPIGEIGLLTGETRGASVHALRTSELFAFSRDAFYAFAQQQPAALMAMTKVILSRLREPTREAKLRAARKTRCIAVVPASAAVNGPEFAAQLHAALGPQAALVNAERAAAEIGPAAASTWAEAPLRDWLSRLEFRHPQLVFDASGAQGWSQTALRQADRVLVVADALTQPDRCAVTETLLRAGLRVPVEVVLLRGEGISAASTLAWKAALFAESHYFVRPQVSADIASLARQITGYGMGLVLGGGGARGFAHIGLLKALQELNMPVDVCGGASMGAFVAALHASGRDIQNITEVVRDTFVHRKLLNDYVLPRVSLIGGKKFRQHLRSIFGEARVEHLRTPFFCVSTNLTRGSCEVHKQGIVADWLAASMCIPGLAPPVGYKGGLLADGAVINSLPTDVMQDLARGPIVASDVSTEGAISAPSAQGEDPDFEAVFQRGQDGQRVGIVDVLFRTTSLTSESGTKARAERADLYLRMPVGSMKTFDWPLLDQIIDKGYRHAINHLPGLLSKLS